jgi:hypothetical protein
MTRDNQAGCEEIETPKAFVVDEVAKEDTPDRLRGELMWHGGGNVRITCATKDMEVFIPGYGSEESDMRAHSTGHLRGETVQ